MAGKRDQLQAHRFLVDVLGFEYLYSLGPFRHDDSDWMQEHLDVAPGLDGPASQPGDERAAVDRLDHVGVAGDRRGLVGLQDADEVPAQPEVRGLAGLRLGLLVPVLPHVADTELGEQADIGGREELGDHDEPDLVVAPGVAARPEPPNVFLSVIGDHVPAFAATPPSDAAMNDSTVGNQAMFSA